MINRRNISNLPFSISLSLGLVMILFMLFIALLSYAYLQQRIGEERALIAVEEEHHVQHQVSMVQDDLRHVAYSLAYLRDQIHLHGQDGSPVNHMNFARDLYLFIQSNELYDQLRYIGADGMEMVRVDYNQGDPVQVVKENLQFKGDRDYFLQTMALEEDEIYISPLELNMEYGKVDVPHKPVIRFGLPVFSKKGERLGILMVNHLAAAMLDTFSSAISPTFAIPMLLNNEGFWLSHPDKDQQWGFQLEQRRQNNMATASPALWKRMIEQGNGQFDFDGSMVTVARVPPFASYGSMQHLILSKAASQRLWRVVSIYPEARLKEHFAPLQKRVVAIALLLMLAVLLMLLLWNGFRQKKQQMEAQLHLHGRAVQESVAGIVIVDTCSSDHPIVYANRAFERMSGYQVADILGKNCRFLQGEDRNQPGARRLADAITEGVDCQIVLRNYRKDGSMFWNEISISPVRDRSGRLTHFVGYQVDVSERKFSEHEREQLLGNLQHLSRQLIDNREEEASRIARALHDDVGQVLAAIQLQTGLTEQLYSKGDYTAAKQSMGHVKEMNEQLSHVISRQLRSIKPGHLEEIGLAASLEDLCRGWQEQLNIVLDVEGLPESLPAKIELCLFRVAQEALTNIIKHSEASIVEVTLKLQDSALYLYCRDDGCGFDPLTVVRGMGLTGMQERVRSLNGSMELDTSPGQGLCLNVCIPLSSDLS